MHQGVLHWPLLPFPFPQENFLPLLWHSEGPRSRVADAACIARHVAADGGAAHLVVKILGPFRDAIGHIDAALSTALHPSPCRKMIGGELLSQRLA